MPDSSTSTRPGGRQAAVLTLVLWTATYVVFVLSGILASGKVSGFNIGLFAPMAGVGLLVSPLLYLLARLTERAPLATRAIVMAAAAIAAAILHGFADAMIWDAVLRAFRPGSSLPGGFKSVVANSFMIYVWVYGLYVAGIGLLLAGLAAQSRERQLAEARAAAHQAQLSALRLQLNPHFLFNTLNAISTLIVTERNADAEAMTAKLSDFLRSSLNVDPEAEAPLDDELATMQTYLDIESVRFGERLSVEVVSPASLLDALVPSFLLQPLVENAVKYAVAPSRRPVSIRVEAREQDGDLVLTVEDDGQAFGALPKGGAGVGLANVRSRLSALYGERGRLEAVARERGFLATVRLPLRRALQRVAS